MKLSFRKAILIYILVPIITLLSLFAINNMTMIKRESLKRIENHMTDLAISYASIFDGFLKPIEGTAIINADLIEESDVLTEKNIYKLLELQVENNPIIYGAAIAFMPNQFSAEQRLFAPYVYRKGGAITHMNIAEQGYDYTAGEWTWWSRVIETGEAAWSEPYFDKGAGNILMSTYAVPFYKDNKLWGVATADIALNKINNQILIPGVRGEEIVVLSSTGQIVLHHEEDEIGRLIYDLIEEKFQAAIEVTGIKPEEELVATKTKLNDLIANMLAGKTGAVNLKYLDNGEGYWSFYAPIKSVGWSFSIGVKESDIFKIVYDQFWNSVLFFCLLLVLTIIAVVLVSGKFSRSLGGLIKRCERIERLNFQPANDKTENIDEILQLSHTLNKMCLVLNSHYSVKEDVRIAEAIRQHSIPKLSIEVEGYQIDFWSNAGRDNCGEIFDIMPCGQTQTGIQQEQENMAFLLLDDTDSGIDAVVKNGQLRAIFRTMIKQGHSLIDIAEQMNDYLIADMNLNGSVQLSLGLLEHNSATFSILNLGQNGVFHYSRQQFKQYKGNPQALAAQKALLGLQVKNIALEANDIIVLCSDGVLGAQNEQREQFGVQLIEEIVQQQSGQTASTLIQSLQSELDAFTEKAYMQTERSIIVVKKC
ncbi:MAG: SpoIIE family protein phosphatase [Methyloprofundus sp.]|nr:SpoIIE family protein phosphatase [Methyloprofundus sp.]